MNYRWPAAATLTLCALGCTTESTGDAPVVYEPFGTANCGAEDNTLSLESIPAAQFLHFFQQTESRCPEPASTMIVIVNTADRVLSIESVMSSGRPFYVVHQDRVRSLGPQERLPVQLSFRPEKAGDFESILTVSAGGQCAQFHLYGRGIPSAEETLLDYSPHVIDFGVVNRGESATEEIAFVVKDGPRDVKVVASNFSASPEIFAVDSRVDALNLARCAPQKVSVTLHAAGDRGVVKGQLGWDVMTTLEDGTTFVGLQQIDLVATVE